MVTEAWLADSAPSPTETMPAAVDQAVRDHVHAPDGRRIVNALRRYADGRGPLA